MDTIVGLLLIEILIYIIYLLLYSLIRGAPYAAIGEERIQNMIDVLQIKPGEKAVDIGAGDGRIVIALAKKGAEAHGFEINPILVWIARQKIKKAGLEKKAFIHWTDIWKRNYSQFDIITMYMTAHATHMLESKIRKELKPGARVVTNHYHFKHWKPTKTKESIHLYNIDNK